MGLLAARLGILAIWTLLGAVPALGWTVSGRVTNSQGQGIAGVDLDFEDQSTGEIIFTPNDDTDFNGNYSTTVPTGTYRIFFNPPLGSNYMTGRLDDQVISSDRVINMILTSGVFVSGYVKDTSGIGLLDVDLNFYDSATGENMGFDNDNTDASGFYHVLVVTNRTYDILYRPPLGDPHVAHRANGVVVGSSDIVRPDVILASGFAVTGRVFRKGTNNPVVGADIDADFSATGQEVTLGFDNTDGNGLYQIVLPAGTFDIQALPPQGQGLAGEVEPDVFVNANTVVDTIFLPVGFTLSGDVKTTGGAPIAGVNLDVVDPVRDVEIPTTGDHTNASGQYSVVVGAGTYNLIYWPPSGMPVAAAAVKNKVISGNTVQPTVVLVPGFVISGTVRRTGGATVSGSDIDAEEIPIGFEYPTLNDDSGVNGAYSIRVPGGPYRFIAGPPAGSGLVADTVAATISMNTVIDFLLNDPNATGIDAAEGPATRRWLGEATPNPARQGTAVRFSVGPERVPRARLAVYSAEGRLVRVLVDGALPGGEQSASWDGTDSHGRPAASGLYFFRLEAGGFHGSSKALLLR